MATAVKRCLRFGGHTEKDTFLSKNPEEKHDICRCKLQGKSFE